MIPLDENSIRSHINTTEINQPLHFHLLNTIDSTNRFLKENPSNEGITICCAETQTQGRGRFGRAWHSPFGENIYFSARWHARCELSGLSGLSLVVSLATLNTLNELGFTDNLSIKWPNDILWHEKKLSGCLIELLAPAKTQTEVVIGIGINVNSSLKASSDTNEQLINRPWCSLFDITTTLYDRNLIIGRLITHLNRYLQHLISHGFAYFLPKWQLVDGLKGRLITVSQSSGSISGIAQGIDHTGQLIIIDSHGNTHALSSGDTSIKCSI